MSLCTKSLMNDRALKIPMPICFCFLNSLGCVGICFYICKMQLLVLSQVNNAGILNCLFVYAFKRTFSLSR